MRKLDLFPFQPILHVDTNCGFMTSFGGGITILLGVTTILAIIEFSKDVFQKNEPFVISSDNVEFFPHFPKEHFQAFISPQMAGGIYIPESDRYVNVRVQIADSDFTDKTRNSTTIFTYFDLVKCNETSMLNNSDYNFGNLITSNLDGYYCLPGTDSRLLDLQGTFGSSKFVIWKFIVESCTNSTLNNFKCKTPEDIKLKLAKFYIHFGLSTFYVDTNDYNSPLKKSFLSRFMRVSTFNYRNDVIFSRLVDYITDSGFILEDKSSVQGTVISRIESDSLYNEKLGPILDIMLTLDAIKQTYMRSYIKIQAVAANIGGIIKFFTLILSFVNRKWGEVMFLKYIGGLVKVKIPTDSKTFSNNYITAAEPSKITSANIVNPLIKKSLKIGVGSLESNGPLSLSIIEGIKFLLGMQPSKNEQQVMPLYELSKYFKKICSIEALIATEKENFLNKLSI